MKNFLLIVIFCVLSSVCSAQQKDSLAIAKVLQNQLVSWNKGSVDGFMLGYWHSDQLRFITKKGVKLGWQQVCDSYKKSYPNAEAMGHLDFKTDYIGKLDRDVYLVTGEWLVAAKDGNKSGYFSLIFRKIKGQWLIVVDHTF